MKTIKTAAFVPAKGSSERIHKKNLIIIDGEYLFKRKLIQLLECKEIDEVWLDSESDVIHKLASNLPIKHLRRSNKFATNKTDGHKLFSYESKHTNADIVVQSLCTAPFLDSKTIDEALKKFKQSNKTSLVAVSKNKFYEWRNNSPLYGDTIPNSLDLPDRIIESMSLYAVKTKGKMVKQRFTKDVLLFELSSFQNIDINNKEDLVLAQSICMGQRSYKVQQFKTLSSLITSALLSDICKDLNIKHFLSKDIKALTKGNFLGFAKTLKIKSLTKNKKKVKKDWMGIFEALKSYDFIMPGDVIVVSTDVPERAYFGELNATFAIRQGTAGVLIDGNTRDIEKVSLLGLPVHAHGSKANDIRYEGTIESMNLPIKINGVLIQNNDIIFADQDGAICIPQNRWETVFSKIKENLKKEMQIKLDATFGSNPSEILEKRGIF